MLLQLAGAVSDTVLYDGRAGKDGCHVCHLSHSAGTVATPGESAQFSSRVFLHCLISIAVQLVVYRVKDKKTNC